MKKFLFPTLKILKCPECGKRTSLLGGAFVQHGSQTDNGKFVACPGSGKVPPKKDEYLK